MIIGIDAKGRRQLHPNIIYGFLHLSSSYLREASLAPVLILLGQLCAVIFEQAQATYGIKYAFFDFKLVV